jgi:hypothetical protein
VRLSFYYTLCRPGGLTLDPALGVSELELNQGDDKSGRIARADVADICVNAIFRYVLLLLIVCHIGCNIAYGYCV